MSFEDIEEAWEKHEKKEVPQAGREHKRKKSTSATAPRRGKKTRAEELEEADGEIDALGMRIYCSVF
jgi:hypothetical protein